MSAHISCLSWLILLIEGYIYESYYFICYLSSLNSQPLTLHLHYYISSIGLLVLFVSRAQVYPDELIKLATVWPSLVAEVPTSSDK